MYELVSYSLGSFVFSETHVPNVFKLSRVDGGDISNEPPSTAAIIFSLIYSDVMEKKYSTNLIFDFIPETDYTQVIVTENGDVPSFLTKYRESVSK